MTDAWWMLKKKTLYFWVSELFMLKEKNMLPLICQIPDSESFITKSLLTMNSLRVLEVK